MSGIVPSGFKSNIRSFIGTQGGTQNSPRKYGRVVDIIMDETHPQWKALGGTQAQYGIFFQELNLVDTVVPDPERNFAFCKQNSFRRLPIKNEIVSIQSDFRADTTEDYGRTHKERFYWTEIIPVWNSTHLNTYPDLERDGSEPADTGLTFVEVDTVKPLQLCEGDVSIEGRHGNTIRLGGTTRKDSPISKKDVNGKPYIVVRTGQAESDKDTVFEDIDKDATSLYMVSDHKVPLTQANTKRKAWRNDKGPQEAKDYKGKQLLVNTDRVFINAREHDIELSSKGETGINAKQVSIDGKDYVAIDADKIYVGTGAFHEMDPLLLGTKTTDWLSNLCTSLDNLLTVMGTTVSPAQLASMAAAAMSCKAQVNAYKATLSSLKSKKSFVE